ncbi:carbon-nitrogen hydrolase, partial [Linnemannia elongata AG-77]
ACLQFAPILGEVQRNIDHATSMVAKLKPEDVDVLILPEMAFSGYVFTSKDHIRPYLENAETGPSIQWAKAQAIRLNAHVQVGYPEKRVVNKTDPFKEEYYNSVAFVSPQGVLLNTYAKHFLYYTDENWAEEGPSFESMPVEGLGQVGFGICMDVNPYQFKTPFSDFEFSSFHFGQKSNLLLCSMAWNKGEEAPKKEKTIHYWAVRMSPFYKQQEKAGGKEPFLETYLAIANRIGTESGRLLFVGSSCVIKLTKDGPELIGALPSDKEGILLVETSD